MDFPATTEIDLTPHLLPLPEHPDSEPLSATLWDSFLAAISGSQPPLGELSFFSLHCWHGGEQVRVSRLGPFAIVRFGDRPNQVMLVHLPGKQLGEEDLEPLRELVAQNEVRYLSATTAVTLAPVADQLGIRLVSLRDDADYTYLMSELVAMEGPAFKAKRRAVSRFIARNSHRVRQGTLDDDWAREHLESMYEIWLSQKYACLAEAPETVRWERNGVHGWPSGEAAARVMVFCLEVDDRPAGVSVVEPMWNDTWMGIVMKTDPRIQGATTFLRQSVARAGLERMGAKAILNIQQDEGSPGLRRAKLSYRPTRLEPKYAALPFVSSPAMGAGS